MKKLLSLVFLGVIFSVPAHAQRSMAGTLGPNGAGYIPGGVGGSGSGGGYGGNGGAGGGTVSFHTLPAIPAAQFNAIDVSGEKAEFIPSSWTDFERGLARGRAELSAEKKTLGEIAAENRKIEKPKAKLEIVQDANGNAIIQRQ
jgi:hypothetical protein